MIRPISFLSAFMLSLLSIGATFTHRSAVQAVTLDPGDLVATVNVGTAANNDPAVMLIDPTTGDRTIISGGGVGSGPSFFPEVPPGDSLDYESLSSVHVQSDGSLLATVFGTYISPSDPAISFGRIIRIDPSTGDRTIVSDSATSAGPMSFYYDAQQFGSSILLSGYSGLLSVDPATGNRTVFTGAGVGSGPAIGSSAGFATAGGTVYVADLLYRIVQVDALTGDRTIISSDTIGSGPSLSTLNGPIDVEVDPTGSLIISTAISAQASPILRVDPVTGNRTILSGPTVGTGPGPNVSGQIGIAADGSIIGADFNDNAILRIDPITGDRTVISDDTHGTGSALFQPYSVTVIPNVPEPSTLVHLCSLAVALAGFSGWRLRKRSSRARQ